MFYWLRFKPRILQDPDFYEDLGKYEEEKPPKQITCTSCHGSKKENCPTCLGEGWTMTEGFNKDCPTCDGKTEIKCSTCNGTGKINE